MRAAMLGAWVLAGCIGLGVGVAGAAAPSTPEAGPGQVMDDLRRAYEALDSRDFEGAAKLYREVGETAESDELRYAAALGLGSALVALGRTNEAATAFERAVALRPADPAALLNLGEAYRDLGRDEEAVTTLGRAVAANPDLVEAYLALTVVLSRLGRLEAAGKAAAKAVRLEPKNPRTHLSLAVTLYHGKFYEQAARAFERALQLEPGNPGAHYGLGLCRLYLEDLEAAKAQLALLEPLDPALAKDLKDRIFEKPKESVTPGTDAGEVGEPPTATPPP